MKRHELLTKIIKILDEQISEKEAIKEITYLIKNIFEFDAVGVRLKKEDDYPYYVTVGFSGDFIEKENYLCARDKENNIIRGKNKSPVLECMCGVVLRGKTDPSYSFFTSYGSFWSSNTSELLETTTEKERQSRTRNRCNSEGYETVILVPLKTDNEIIGLLQINDRKKDKVDLEIVQFFESVGQTISVVLKRTSLLKQIEQNKIFMREIIDSSPNLVFVKDIKGKYILANKAVAELYGTTVKEIEGKEDIYYVERGKVSLEEIEDYLEADREVIINKKIKQIPEESVTDKNGDVRYFQTTKIPFIFNGHFDCVLGVSSDITERKKIEENIRKITNELKRSNEELQQYAYLASHDLQAPLRIIKNYCELMDDFYKEKSKEKIFTDEEEIEMDKYLKFVMNSVDRMRKLIRDLLEYSKAGNLLGEYEKFNVNELLNEVFSSFDIKKKNIRIDINKTFEMFANKMQLSRIFHNLIDNSIKFKSKDRDIFIEIGVENREEDFLFYIKDNGLGIDKKHLKKIFYLFNRLYTEEEYKGSGLGLAFVKKLVNSHGGEVWVESEVGEGSTFYFTIAKKEKI